MPDNKVPITCIAISCSLRAKKVTNMLLSIEDVKEHLFHFKFYLAKITFLIFISGFRDLIPFLGQI